MKPIIKSEMKLKGQLCKICKRRVYQIFYDGILKFTDTVVYHNHRNEINGYWLKPHTCNFYIKGENENERPSLL